MVKCILYILILNPSTSTHYVSITVCDLCNSIELAWNCQYKIRMLTLSIMTYGLKGGKYINCLIPEAQFIIHITHKTCLGWKMLVLVIRMSWRMVGVCELVIALFLFSIFTPISSLEEASTPQYACGDTEAGAYYRGYSSSQSSVISSADCRKRCQDTDNCQFWSWFASDSTNWANNCYFGPSRSSRRTDSSAAKALTGNRNCEQIFV